MGTLTVEIAAGIATVTLDRPPVNAVDGACMREMAEVFTSFADRRDVCVAIFTAAGSRAFIGGVDLKSIDGATAEAPRPSALVDPGAVARDAMWAITDCAVPVIGAINGPAIGAGLAFAACCDILVAADTATFGTTEINVGLLGASSHLSRLVGNYKAREMFFTGELVPASELYRLGAVRSVVPLADLLPTARELATVLAAKSPLALRMAKDSMNRVEGLPLKEGYRTEQDYTNRLLQLDDSSEARKAFLEKRDPTWSWR